MEGLVQAILCILAISLSEAYLSNPQQLQIFEIRQNRKTKDIKVEPIRLHYDLDSAESKLSRLVNMQRSNKKMKKVGRTNTAYEGAFMKLLQALEDHERQKQKINPIVLVMSDNKKLSEKGGRPLKFVDETRSLRNGKIGSKLLYDIVKPTDQNKLTTSEELQMALRTQHAYRTKFPPFEDRSDE